MIIGFHLKQIVDWCLSSLRAPGVMSGATYAPHMTAGACELSYV